MLALFTELLDMFGMQRPEGATIDEICEFSANHWDFRRQADGSSVERNEVGSLDDDGLEEIVVGAAARLGLRTPSEPAHDHYDHVLILGGLIRASLLRPALAAALIDGRISAGTVAGIGGYRPLRGDELQLASLAGLDGLSNEVEAMDSGLRTAFGTAVPGVDEGTYDAEDPHRSWLVRRYEHPDLKSLMLVAAPSSDPANRRANTPDTYRYWAESLVHLQPSDRVLLVTSAIYAPFQSLDGIRMLSLTYRCGVEVVGTMPGDTVAGVPAQKFGATQYLQETNSTLRSIRTALEGISKPEDRHGFSPSDHLLE